MSSKEIVRDVLVEMSAGMNNARKYRAKRTKTGWEIFEWEYPPEFEQAVLGALKALEDWK